MVIILVFAVIVVGIAALAVAASGKPPTAVEHHHVTVIERPAAIQAQIFLIKAEIRLAETKMAPAPIRLPKATALVRPSTAIERYRSQGRSPT